MKLSHLVVTIMLPVLLTGCSGDQDKVVIKYCKALEAGKYDEAASYLSKDAKMVLDHAGGNKLLADAESKFIQRKGIKSIKITNKKVKDNRAAVELMYNFNDGTKYGDKFPLVKENGTWKISN